METSSPIRGRDNDGDLYFPDDVVTNILGMLPVKPLIRFKSVSKRWYNIITNPTFISLHLTNTQNGKRLCSDICSGVLFSSFHCSKGYIGQADSPYDFLKLYFGVTIEDGRIFSPGHPNAGLNIHTPYSIVGYSDGIFCLSCRHLRRDISYYDEGHEVVIALCNPAIMEFRRLPSSDSDLPPYKPREDVEIGFGFDPKTNDYKVVKIVCFRESKGCEMIEVYSMRSNSWRIVLIRGNDNYSSMQNIRATAYNTGIYTNDNGCGVLHWTMSKEVNEKVIVSFLMDDDSLRVTRLPKKYSSKIYNLHISALENKLALLYMYGYDSTIWPDILVMKSYELDDDSWSLVTTIERALEHGAPLGVWKDNLLLVFDNINGTPTLFDISTKQSTNLRELDEMHYLDPETMLWELSEMECFYKETLVPVKLNHDAAV